MIVVAVGDPEDDIEVDIPWSRACFISYVPIPDDVPPKSVWNVLTVAAIPAFG